MELAPGTLLKDRYRIQRKLGQGGMGAVFLARDLALDVDVAVKARRMDQAAVGRSGDGGDLFLREARLLAALRHPNLPRVTDYFLIGETPYLVMDYIPGEDLDELIKKEGRQPLERVVAWAGQLGSALTYMHRQAAPIIHRDIKPGNIKLTADGQAVLVDFGIAKMAAPDQATATSLRGYTPGFAPPEQYGSGHTGPQSDQYSFAATLYRLLSGHKPAEAIQRVLGQAELAPLLSLIPELSPAVAAVIERGLAIKPEDRYPDVAAFVGSLEAAARMSPPPVWQPAAGSAAPTVVRTAAFPPPAEPTLIRPPPAGGLPPLVASGAPQLQPAAKGKRFPGWLLPLLLIGGFIFTAILVGGGLLAAGWIRGRAAPTAQIALVPEPTETAAAEIIPAPTETATAEPTPTETPPPTETAAPSPTASETAQPPTATPLPLGQGGWIAFASDRADGKTLQIWLLRAWLNDQGLVETGEAVQLTSGEGDKRQPGWSPDGKELLYVAPGEPGQGLDIWRMPLDGSASAVNLTRRKGDQTDPAWSPDGTRIAFTDNSREDGALQLYLMEADGANLLRLSFDQNESAPAWSPDMKQLGFVLNAAGARIFFLRAPQDPKAATPQPEYYVTPQPFDRSAVTGSLGQVGEPAWSPDGTFLAYTRLQPNAERVFLAHFPVRDPEADIIPLAEGSRDLSPAWSPDSQWITFVSYRDGNPELYVMRSTGKNQNRLTDAPGVDLDPAWQPLAP